MIYSKQREIILQELRARDCHPTAEVLYAALKPAHPELSLATVYRNLNQLAENGMAQKISVPRGADRFDASRAAHHHMVCEQCGALVDIPREYVGGGFDSSISWRTGCLIRAYDVLFYGLCPACNAADAGRENE
jgi:Fur family peroxide stress response transcriptional regulator